MFVESSALAAMLIDEDKARVLAGRLQAAPHRITAAPSVIKAVAEVAAARTLSPDRVGAVIARFLDLMGIKLVSLPATIAFPAAAAMERFGRAPDRPHGLTPSQCLSYAAARYYRLPLLFDDMAFAATDIEAG